MKLAQTQKHIPLSHTHLHDGAPRNEVFDVLGPPVHRQSPRLQAVVHLLRHVIPNSEKHGTYDIGRSTERREGAGACVCVCAFLNSIDRACRLADDKTPVGLLAQNNAQRTFSAWLSLRVFCLSSSHLSLLASVCRLPGAPIYAIRSVYATIRFKTTTIFSGGFPSFFLCHLCRCDAAAAITGETESW